MADWRRAFSQAFDTGGRAFGNAYLDIAEEKRRKEQEAKEGKRRAQDDYDRTGRWDSEYLGAPPPEKEQSIKVPTYISGSFGDAPALQTEAKFAPKYFEERVGNQGPGPKQYQDIRKTDQYRERVAANKAATERLSALTSAFGVAPTETYEAMSKSKSMDAGDVERTTIQAVQAQEERRRREAEAKAERDKVVAERAGTYGRNARYLNEAKRVGVDPTKSFADDDAYAALLNATFAKDPKGEKAPSGLEVLTDRMKRLEAAGAYLWGQARGNPEEAYNYGIRLKLSPEDALEAVNLARASAEREAMVGPDGRAPRSYNTRLPRQNGATADERRDWMRRSGIGEPLAPGRRSGATPSNLFDPIGGE